MAASETQYVIDSTENGLGFLNNIILENVGRPSLINSDNLAPFTRLLGRLDAHVYRIAIYGAALVQYFEFVK